MAYRLKPGKLGRKAMAAYDKVQRAFIGRFLEKDPDSPSGYTLRTGETGRKAAAAYQAIEGPCRGCVQEGRDGLCRRFFGRNRPFAQDGGGATANRRKS